MSEGRRRWARIFTASSTLLLLLAIFAFLQMTGDLEDSYDPEENNIARLEPGEQKAIELKTSALVTALRESIDDSNDAELRLYVEEGSEVSGKSPNWRHPTRFSGDGEREYVPVRVFEEVNGEYTLHNDGESTLWLVDDEEAANMMLSNGWTYAFFFGCCLGAPVGFIELVLAVMVWTDKRKKPDQFLVIDDGRVIISEPEDIVEINGQEASVPGPFVDVQIENPKVELIAEVDESWKGWDDG